MQVSLEIVRLGTTRKKKSHEHGFKIYIYIYTRGLLPDWERKKKKKPYAFFKNCSWDSRTYALCGENYELWAATAILL